MHVTGEFRILFSRFLSDNIKVKIYKIVILPVLVCRVKGRLRCFGNRALRRIFETEER
jgi:hypothetical protein